MGVCILYNVGTNLYTLLEHISIYCWSSYPCTSTQLYIVGAHFYALSEHFGIHCWIVIYTLLHNSIYCSMHCLGWDRHDSGSWPEVRGSYTSTTPGASPPVADQKRGDPTPAAAAPQARHPPAPPYACIFNFLVFVSMWVSVLALVSFYAYQSWYCWDDFYVIA